MTTSLNRRLIELSEVMYMPCQCSNPTVASDADTAHGGCACSTESAGPCECGGGAPPPSDRDSSLERVVMELDKRVRKLEAGR